jgi:hypothetical protein
LVESSWKRKADKRQVKSEKLPSAKKRRARKAKAPLGNVNINIPAVQNSSKCGRRRRSGTKPKAEAAAVGVMSERRTSNQNKLDGLGNNPFSVMTNDEDEEFKLTVANMSKKHQMSIFKDSEVDSPGKIWPKSACKILTDGHAGRTESPLDDHRYDS